MDRDWKPIKFRTKRDDKDDAARAMLAALEDMRTQLHVHVKTDVKKHFRLLVADAAAGTAIAAARAAGIGEK